MRSPTGIYGVPEHVLRSFEEILLANGAVLSHFCVLNTVCILPIYLSRPRNWSTKTEVAKFDRAVLIYQNIGRLYVSVHDSRGMQEVHSMKQVVEYL